MQPKLETSTSFLYLPLQTNRYNYSTKYDFQPCQKNREHQDRRATVSRVDFEGWIFAEHTKGSEL